RVTCRFKFNNRDIEDRVDMKKLDPRIRKMIGTVETISLTRSWEDDMDSHMIMGDEVQEIYNETHDQEKKRANLVLVKLERMSKEVAEASKAVNKATDELGLTREKVESVKLRISELKRTVRKFSSREKKDEVKKEMALEEEMHTKLNEAVTLKKDRLEEKQDILEALDEKQDACRKLEETDQQIKEQNEALVTAQENLREILQMTGMYPSDKEQRAAEIREEICRTDIEKLKSETQHLKQAYETQLLALEFVFDGLTFDSAVKSAEKEIESRNKYYTSNELAEEVFKLLPDFELFEDFSSLLPNRIDLEDIIRANKRAEGYKAALNFLTITGLEYSFFQQPSSRILKQKIENLNGELTLNFQDFWR
ncbi:MAG: hypothetical protein KAT15_07930, partial [Bacteroidales bacterium]|nr:hypothetical protein [Bacteroidales bacterium]